MISWAPSGALHYRPQNGKGLLCRNLDRDLNTAPRAHTLGRSPLRQAPVNVDSEKVIEFFRANYCSPFLQYHPLTFVLSRPKAPRLNPHFSTRWTFQKDNLRLLFCVERSISQGETLPHPKHGNAPTKKTKKFHFCPTQAVFCQNCWGINIFEMN